MAPSIDASRWAGLEIDVFGNDESYNLRLRTPRRGPPLAILPSQLWSQRRNGKTPRLPFAEFEAHRIDTTARHIPHSPHLAIVAIGRAFHADIADRGRSASTPDQAALSASMSPA